LPRNLEPQMNKLEDKPPYIRYELVPVEDRAATIANGHYTASDVLHVFITPAGSKDELVYVADEWLVRQQEAVKGGRLPVKWLEYYHAVKDAFLKGLEPPPNGTPLTMWPGISPAQLKNLLSANLRSIEDVAGMNEEAVKAVGMGARALQQRAQAYLDVLKSGVGAAAEANNALKVENANLAARQAQLEQELASLKLALQSQVQATTHQPPPQRALDAADILG
jgi:hypothetical protein